MKRQKTEEAIRCSLILAPPSECIATLRSRLKPEVQEEYGGGVLGRQPQGKTQLVPNLPRNREVGKDDAVFQVRQ